MNTNIKKYVLPNLPYLLIFWLFDLFGEAYRVSAGADIDRVANAVINMDSILSVPIPSFAPDDLLVGLLGAAAVRGVVYFKSRDAKKFRKNIEYGSARWGTPKDIKPYIDPVFQKNVLLMAGRARQHARATMLLSHDLPWT